MSENSGAPATPAPPEPPRWNVEKFQRLEEAWKATHLPLLSLDQRVRDLRKELARLAAAKARFGEHTVTARGYVQDYPATVKSKAPPGYDLKAKEIAQQIERAQDESQKILARRNALGQLVGACRKFLVGRGVDPDTTISPMAFVPEPPSGGWDPVRPEPPAARVQGA